MTTGAPPGNCVMNTARTFVALAALLALCSKAPAQDPTKDEARLVGKWDFREKIGEAEVKFQVEFTRDGKIRMNLNAGGMDFVIEGTWKFVGGDTIETTATFMNQTQTQRTKIKLGRDTLEMTDPQGMVKKLTRAR
jgi:uncharacterized protein (TIGR03066 family)